MKTTFFPAYGDDAISHEMKQKIYDFVEEMRSE